MLRNFFKRDLSVVLEKHLTTKMVRFCYKQFLGFPPRGRLFLKAQNMFASILYNARPRQETRQEATQMDSEVQKKHQL